ncbi:MFS transporter [Reyranella sp. CPCC 100927]|uniref:MFS transporter n=1 Tax=Reyranella sp. CPCC 100927 TaxID=2599616 RepID=UPI0011B4753D|nr:MFS transporter [Reyranella sp. CPCC 100927]TWS98315.1 MFS transporter [Reyranella sp. CPCC 100927]
MKVSYGWVIVGVGMVVSCIGFGAMFSLAVFLNPITEATGWSRSGTSAAATLNFLCMGVASFGWGALSDRYGARTVVLLGGTLLAIGLALASQTTSLLAFQVLFGMLVGAAAGAFFAPMTALAMAWIEHRRNLAAALVSAGMGMGSMTVAPLARWIITNHDWRLAMLVLAVVVAAVILPAAFLLRPAPSAPGVNGASGAASDDPGMTVAQALRTPQFAIIALTFFACCATHSGPIFHMVSYAMSCGVSAMAATTVLSTAGLAGLAGRLGGGLIADRIGAKPTIVIGLALQAVAVSLYLVVSELGAFYALSLLFGIAYGSVMPLYAVLVRTYFGARIMGTVFGAVSMISAMGMALGPWAGGWVFDTFAGYNWLYIGSLIFGLCAVAIALTFKPPATAAARPGQPVPQAS